MQSWLADESNTDKDIDVELKASLLSSAPRNIGTEAWDRYKAVHPGVSQDLVAGDVMSKAKIKIRDIHRATVNAQFDDLFGDAVDGWIDDDDDNDNNKDREDSNIRVVLVPLKRVLRSDVPIQPLLRVLDAESVLMNRFMDQGQFLLRHLCMMVCFAMLAICLFSG
jgi:hypothetical protein